MRIPALISVILAAFAPLGLAQTTWYVDVSGTPPGTGTQADPFTTIQAAIDQAAQFTDTIIVSPGVYAENLTDDKGVSIQGAGPELCLLEPAGTSPGLHMLGYGGGLSGFTVTGGGGDGVRVGSSATIKISNCLVSNNAGDGLDLGSSVWAGMDDVNFCTIVDNGGAGVRVKSAVDMHSVISWGNGLADVLPIQGGPHSCCCSFYSYSDIEEHQIVPNFICTSSPFPGLIDSEPFFVDPDNGDYHLLPGSPCIGTGLNNQDMGALPFQLGSVAGTNYCTSGTSASGCQALIGAMGTPSATASSGFLLSVTNLEGKKDGLFFYGTNGRQAGTWGNGTSFVCVVPPRVRGSLLTGVGPVGSCAGQFTMDLNARWCSTCPKPAHNPGAGAVGQAQLWYRDPASTSNQTSSMSDAVEYVVGP